MYSLRPGDAYMRRQPRLPLVQIMALSPVRHRDTIWTYAGILATGPMGRNFSDILIEIQTFWFTKMRESMSSAKLRSFCLGRCGYHRYNNQWPCRDGTILALLDYLYIYKLYKSCPPFSIIYWVLRYHIANPVTHDLWKWIRIFK